jgi:hypothetical protein
LTQGVGNLPGWAQAISVLIPLRYAGDIIQGLIANKSLLDELGTLLVLLAYGIVLMGVATLTLREYD